MTTPSGAPEMDQLTPSLRRELLRLAGVTPLPPQAAVCALEVAPDEPVRPALSRLVSRQEVPFELLEPIPVRRLALEQVQVEQGGQTTDVHGLLAGDTGLKPFAFGGQGGSAARNPFAAGQTPPRGIAWSFGDTAAQPLTDETHAFSQSGYVTLETPDSWSAGADGLYWLQLTLTRAGCEEQPRLLGVSDRRYQAAQQCTYARSCRFTLPAQAGQRAVLPDALARIAELAVFLRTPAGWEQTAAYQQMQTEEGRILLLDAQGALEAFAQPYAGLLLSEPIRIERALLLYLPLPVPGNADPSVVEMRPVWCYEYTFSEDRDFIRWGYLDAYTGEEYDMQ